MNTKASFSSLPFEITRKIVINVLEDTKFDYLRRPNVCNFIESAKTNKEYLYIYPVMPLRLVSKSFKETVDSIIFRVLEIQHETPVISCIYETQAFMDHFTMPRISSGYPFGVAGLAMDQFNDFYGIMSPDERSQVFSSYYQFKLGRDLFRHVIHLYIYSCPEFDAVERVALLSPSPQHLVPENFPKLRKVTLSLSNDQLSKNNTNVLRKFFIYFREPRNQQPIEIDLNMKDILEIKSSSFFSLINVLEISKLVVSLTISRCDFSLEELENVWSFTNMKSFVIRDYYGNIDFLESLMSHHKIIQQLKALEKFEVYNLVSKYNSLSLFTVIPPTITSLTLSYYVLLNTILMRLDTKKLCSAFVNVKDLHVYAIGNFIFPEDRDMGLANFCSDDPTIFSFPKLESLKSTFHSPSTSLYAVMFDKIMTPNKHTIKKLHWDLDDNIDTMGHVQSDLTLIEEFSLSRTADSEMTLFDHLHCIHNLGFMTGLQKLSCIAGEDMEMSRLLMTLALRSINVPKLMPQLQSIDGLYYFAIDFSSLDVFQFKLDDMLTHVAEQFISSVRFSGLELVPRPFDLLTMVTEEGPFYPLGSEKGMYIKGHFSLDVKKFRKLVMNTREVKAV